LEGFAQFDLMDHEDKLHSQYLEIQYDFFPVSGLQITTGAIAEVLEDGGGEYRVAFGGLAETGIRLQSPAGDSENRRNEGAFSPLC
jgi:hypothetical protein